MPQLNIHHAHRMTVAREPVRDLEECSDHDRWRVTVCRDDGDDFELLLYSKPNGLTLEVPNGD